MKKNVRAAMAAVALAHNSKHPVSSIYDYSGSGYINVDATAHGDRIEAYDYSASCSIDGTVPSLYHFGISSHIELTPAGGGRYDGYDYDSGSHFEVSVNGSEVEIYDYGASGFFSYSR